MQWKHRSALCASASEVIFANARVLRRNETKAEQLLWQHLRNRKCGGLKFRRQHPLHKYVADFFCFEKKLVVEVDGDVHLSEEVKIRDEERALDLNNLGYKILRFTNNEIERDIHSVLAAIRLA